MLTSNNCHQTVSINCTEACYLALNSGKGLLSCVERRICIAIMQNNAVSKIVYQKLLDQVDVDKLVDEGYLIKRHLNNAHILDRAEPVKKKSLVQASVAPKASYCASETTKEKRGYQVGTGRL